MAANTMVFKMAVGPDAPARRLALAREAGVASADLGDATLFLTGTASEVCDRLLEYRRRVGLSYFSLFDPGESQIEYPAEQVVRPLVRGAVDAGSPPGASRRNAVESSRVASRVNWRGPAAARASGGCS